MRSCLIHAPNHVFIQSMFKTTPITKNRFIFLDESSLYFFENAFNIFLSSIFFFRGSYNIINPKYRVFSFSSLPFIDVWVNLSTIVCTDFILMMIFVFTKQKRFFPLENDERCLLLHRSISV